MADYEIIEKVTENLKRSGCLEPFEARDIIEQKDIQIAELIAEIDRQKAEIERLETIIRDQEDEIEYLKIAQNAIKHSAIKEFAERLKETIPHFEDGYTTMKCVTGAVKYLLKEMVDKERR